MCAPAREGGDGGVLLEVLVEGGELGEGRCELLVVDLFSVDLERLEEGLVEESPLGVVGLQVGGLDIVGELEGVVEGFEDRLVLGFVPLEEVVGGRALAADACLLFGVDVLADLVLVAEGEELAFLVVEPGELRTGAGGLLLGDLRECGQVGVDGSADARALLVAELDRGVVAFDGGFDCFDAVVGLAADAGLAAGADEVVVEAAVPAFRLGEEEPAAASGAGEAAA